jgi:hypothetical protein
VRWQHARAQAAKTAQPSSIASSRICSLPDHHDVGPSPCSAIEHFAPVSPTHARAARRTHDDGIRRALELAREPDALARPGRAGLLVDELVRLDAHAHGLARVDVHPVARGHVEQGRDALCERGVREPEVRALLRVAARRWCECTGQTIEREVAYKAEG